MVDSAPMGIVTFLGTSNVKGSLLTRSINIARSRDVFRVTTAVVVPFFSEIEVAAIRSDKLAMSSSVTVS